MSTPSLPPPTAVSSQGRVDPLYYAFHAIFLTLGTILLSLALHTLYKEITARGWEPTPRNWWLVSLCVTASIFVLFQLDPRTYAGIYSPAWVKFVDYLALICLLQSVSFALFLYLQIVFRRNLAQVPKKLLPAWFGFNFVCCVLEFISILVGSIVKRIFWYGVVWVVMVLHELVLLICLNMCLWQVSRTIIATTKAAPEKVSNRGYAAALRKLLYLRIIACIIVPAVIAYQIFSPDGVVNRLNSWSRSIAPPKNERFEVLVCFSPLFTCISQCALIYAARRPPSRDPQGTVDRQSSVNSGLRNSRVKMMASQDESTLKSSTVQAEDMASQEI